jgi:hypothetical protein
MRAGSPKRSLCVGFLSVCVVGVDGGLCHSQMIETQRKLNALARLSGCLSADRFNYFPGWSPNVTSVALAHTQAAHSTLFPGIKPKVYAVHAGLECGLIQGRYPNIDCVSIGPTILDAHTPGLLSLSTLCVCAVLHANEALVCTSPADERLKISSAKPFYDWLVKTIENLAESTATATAAAPAK